MPGGEALADAVKDKDGGLRRAERAMQGGGEATALYGDALYGDMDRLDRR
jgi:hypothetical protein